MTRNKPRRPNNKNNPRNNPRNNPENNHSQQNKQAAAGDKPVAAENKTASEAVENKKTTTPQKAQQPPAEAEKKPAQATEAVPSSDKADKANKADNKATEPKPSAEKAPQPLAKDNATADKATASKTDKADKTDKPTEKDLGKDSAKDSVKQQPKPSAPASPTLNDKQATAKNKGSLVAVLGLLLGVTGTVLGAYSFNELRMLKTQFGNTGNVGESVTALTDKVNLLESNLNTDELKQQLADLAKQQSQLQATEARFNERVAGVEQMQKGLSKSVANDIETALKDRLGKVDGLLAKVKDIELGQQGLSKNLSQFSAGQQAVGSNMASQEVGYLLRMANYKIQTEGDVLGASGLLQMAESQWLALKEGQPDALIDAIRGKLIQLSGVELVDTNILIAKLNTMSQQIPKLVVKPSEGATQAVAVNAAENDQGTWAKVKSVMTAGIKYTPADPSQIDISAETILIEKRLMQADIKTAEFAVRSGNNVLLAQSMQSIKEALNQYFAQDETAAAVNQLLNELSQSQLETVLPDLSVLVKQFESAQQ